MTSSPASRWRRAVDSRLAPLTLLAIFAVLVGLTIRRFSIWIDESGTMALVGLFHAVERRWLMPWQARSS